MQAWKWFWTLSLIIAGFSFFFITVVVVFKGFADLKDMFSRLKEQHDKG